MANPDPVVDAPEAESASVEVTVAGNFQVSYEGNVYGPGETLTVPRVLAEKWTINRWVTTTG